MPTLPEDYLKKPMEVPECALAATCETSDQGKQANLEPVDEPNSLTSDKAEIQVVNAAEEISEPNEHPSIDEKTTEASSITAPSKKCSSGAVQGEEQLAPTIEGEQVHEDQEHQIVSIVPDEQQKEFLEDDDLDASSTCGDGSTISVTTSTSSSSLFFWESCGIVGRDAEIMQLHEAVVRSCAIGHKAEAVLIYGSSGSGKTALVRKVQQDLWGHHSSGRRKSECDGKMAPLFWVSGKYGQFEDEERPYQGIVDATTELCEVLHESSWYEPVVAAIRQQLRADELHALTTVVPALQELLQTEEEGDILPPSTGLVDELEVNTAATTELFRRFDTLFRQLLHAITSTTKQLVVFFIDDLQWADEVSRKLLGSFVGDQTMANFLLIGAVRTGERQSFHMPEGTMEVTRIVYEPLGDENINALIAGGLNCSSIDTRELSEFIYSRTGGNPLFTVEFVELLYREGLLTKKEIDIEPPGESVCPIRTHTFTWKMDDVMQAGSSYHGVEDLLSHKIDGFPSDVKLVLLTAGLIGFTFKHSVILSIVDESSFISLFPDDLKPKHDKKLNVKEALKRACRAGLLCKLLSNQYSFSHDRVQQAATSFLPQGEDGDRIQGKLGQILYEMSSSQSHGEDWMLFSAVSMLNKYGNENMTPDVLAACGLQACVKARSQAAYALAADYADTALGHLGDPQTAFTQHYSAALELASISAEMTNAFGDFKRTAASVKIVRRYGKSPVDQFRANCALITSFGIQNEWQKDLDECLVCLESFGVKLSRNPNKLLVLYHLARARNALKRRTASDVVALPAIKNRRELQLQIILGLLGNAAYYTGDNDLLLLVCLVYFRSLVLHGLSRYSPYGVCGYGIALAVLGRNQEAFEFGRAALTIGEQYGGFTRGALLSNFFLIHLREPLISCLEGFGRGYQVGMEQGETPYAVHCLKFRNTMCVFCGLRLNDAERYVEERINSCANVSYSYASYILSSIVKSSHLVI